jgi:hypothetical protein
VFVAPELEQIRREVEAITCGWSSTQWDRALPGKWTTAQIFEHLLLTYTGTTKGLRRALDNGSVTTGTSTLPHRVRKFAVTKFGYMPSGREAFRQIMPGEGLSADSMRRFYDALVAMDSTLFDAERRFGRRARLLDHPFLGPLNAQEWRLFHRTHTRHHLKQVVERVRSTGIAPERPVSA